MLPASNQGLGMNMGFPDVCLTPAAPAPVPIPYPNIGANAMSMPFMPTCLISFAPGHNMGAKPLMTNGDNAGVAHPLVMQSGGNNMGIPKVLMQGLPAETLVNPCQGNNYNCPLDAKLVPSITNCLVTWSAPENGWTPAALERAGRQLRGEAGPALSRGRAGVWGVIRLERFELGLATRLDEALEELSDCRGLVLDLRANPGGALSTCAELAGRFLPGGTPLVDLGQDFQRLRVLAAPAQRWAGRLVVVVDRGTASAAEVLAGALAQAGVPVVGEPTFGKTQGLWAALDAQRLRLGSAVALRRPGRTEAGLRLRPTLAADPQAAPALALRVLRAA